MKIGVVAPSRFLQAEVSALIAPLVPAGIEVVYHPQCFLSQGHFAGSDKQRLDAFVEVANDRQYDVVWFARGGYGSCRFVIDAMPLLNDAARAKTYIGFSDLGFMLAGLYKNGVGKPVHGPMPGGIVSFSSEEPIKRVFDYLKSGKGIEPSCSAAPTVAFSMSVLASLAATPLMPKLDGHVVMLEDVSEHLYAIDRYLFTIMNAPRMRGVAGVRLGRVNEIPENDIPFGETPEEIIQRWCQKTGIPYLGRADIGHDADNKIVPFGKL